MGFGDRVFGRLLSSSVRPYCRGVTVIDAIQRSGEFLTRKGVDSPRLQAELLLAHVLRTPRLQLYLNFDRVLTVPEADAYRSLVQRRGTREPLQHILGTAPFYGLEMTVNRHVLVPRPETELLVEQAIRWIEARTAAAAPDGPTPLNILDFGTGSGCIAVTIAAKCPAVRVTAVDASGEALQVARGNAARHRVESRVTFLEADGRLGVPDAGPFDLLVSNPPYIPTAEIETLDPEVRDHDPRLALDGGADGLAFYRMIAGEGKRWMNTTAGSAILLEFGDGQGPDVRSLMDDAQWRADELIRDYSGRERILIARRTG